jgi:hypothetical protein
MAAMRIYALAANGMGGIDWGAVPMLAAWLGVSDTNDLMHRLEIIKTYRRPEDRRN